MAGKKKTDELTALVADTIGDGKGGFLAKGAKFTPADDEAGAQLKARKLAA